ncbi:hypothetical protein BJ944DRAFT_258577 [Cunninghamella echinulata]|nr:hypothetical protein BJ944DRAFT_258577 [Cunninghamella echinulata]
MNALLILITLFITLTYVKAIPQFNTVNGYYHNGTKCPPLTKRNVPCPSLCVSSLSLCPLPACSLTICGDGSCKNDCSSIPPPSTCSCPAKPGVVLYQCPVSTTIDIPNWNPSQNNLQTYTICSQKYNASSVYPTWNTLSDNSNSSITWDVCDSPNGIEFPIKGKFIIYIYILH